MGEEEQAGSCELPVDPDLPPPERRWDTALVVAAGGFFGGGLRFTVSHLLPTATFPWATLVENVSGSLLLAVLMVLVTETHRPHRYVRPFLGVGVLGGYTTFSTYALDGHALLTSGRSGLALAYLTGSLAAGVSAAAAGVSLTRRATRSTL